MSPKPEAQGSSLPTKVVVGTDGSPTATVALERAAALVKVLGASLRVVCAYRDPSRGEGPWPGAAPVDAASVARAAAAAQQTADRGVELARSLGLQEVDGRAVQGDPAEALLEEAEAWGAQLIVVGSRGMRSAARFLLGSVPNRVTHHASCDVLVVHTSR
ncbi:MAG TPA: universal stress protein [Acidimicrobiales bacterium]|nr:universal stress protein [Acidimicrobiales bacterium]